MSDYRMDIVIPVWNRPVETRTALVSLIHHTPGARFILVDNGSDRETELLLQEFAEGLAERCLLVRSERNEGVIRAVNRGFALVQAPVAGVVASTTTVGTGWSESLIALFDAETDVGVVLPPLVTPGQKGRPSRREGRQCQEAAELSLAALLIRRTLLLDGLAFDEGLDGSTWCMRDFARAVHGRGWRICRSAGPAVHHNPVVLFGSPARRQAMAEGARERVLGRWGTDGDFMLQVEPGATFGPWLTEQLAVALLAARQGHRLTVLLPPLHHDRLEKSGGLPRHEGIEIVRLPRFLAKRGIGRCLNRLHEDGRCPELVLLGDGVSVTDSFARFATLVATREAECYGR
jgi:hypothetical protein